MYTLILSFKIFICSLNSQWNLTMLSTMSTRSRYESVAFLSIYFIHTFCMDEIGLKNGSCRLWSLYCTTIPRIYAKYLCGETYLFYTVQYCIFRLNFLLSFQSGAILNNSISSLKVSLILNYPVYTFTIPVYINSDTWFLFIFAEPIPGSTWHLQSISWNTPYLPKRTEKYQRGNEAIVCTCRWLQKKWIIWKPRTRSNPNVAWPHSVCNTLHCFQNTIIPRVGHLSLMG